MDLATLQQQLPQLEICCERLYTAQVCARARARWRRCVLFASHGGRTTAYADFISMQNPGERTSAEQSLRPFTTSTKYAPHLKVCSRVACIRMVAEGAGH